MSYALSFWKKKGQVPTNEALVCTARTEGGEEIGDTLEGGGKFIIRGWFTVPPSGITRLKKRRKRDNRSG